MQIVNESDMDVTWWCYTAGTPETFGTLPGGKGDLAPGARASYTPPPNIVWVEVRFTSIDGSRTWAPWEPSNAATFARISRANWNDTVTFRRGSGKWEAVNAAGSGPQVR
jgi:hypothetical protein